MAFKLFHLTPSKILYHNSEHKISIHTYKYLYEQIFSRNNADPYTADPLKIFFLFYSFLSILFHFFLIAGLIPKLTAQPTNGNCSLKNPDLYKEQIPPPIASTFHF